MIEDTSHQLLTTFASTPDSSARVRALTNLMTAKIIPKQAEDVRFAEGLERWVLLANASDSDPRERLLAIAELIRATQQLRKRQPVLIGRIQAAFMSRLPPLMLLEDSEARLNVARACSMIDAPWLQPYRAASVAEETAPKARAEMMEGIVTRAATIIDVLDLLTAAFKGMQPDTENPAESLARRLTKTLEVFRGKVLGSNLDAGADVGKKLDGFIRSTLISTGRPKEESVQLELTREVALTLHDLVRSRFSLATEPETFQALQYCRSFFPTISWPTEVQVETNFLVQDVSEALVLLGRMGVQNQDLLNRLELVCGMRDRARSVAIRLADKNPDIDESIRGWLRTGRVSNSIIASEVLQETLLANLDEPLGLALVEARSLNELGDFERRLGNSLLIFEPDLVPDFKSFQSNALAMRTAIEDLAKRRELDLWGNVGEEIEFSPKYFEPLVTLKSTRVIVRRPAVVKRKFGAAVGRVVKKGLVE
jgi:hypothetical protein